MKKNQVRPNREEPSKMAEDIAMHRFVESAKPENERVCYDPYAIHFLDPKTLKLLKVLRDNPELAKKKVEEGEKLFPGLTNSIIARVRYFDDFVEKSIESIEQLVIVGAGYDTRAYRIDGLQENVKIFEIDHPHTQSFKIQKLKEIFGSVPDHVAYVSVDFENEKFSKKLIDKGYDPSKKTLFIMEGLLMYITPKSVDETLSFIVENSVKGSSILFDYLDESVVKGTCQLGKSLQDFTGQKQEPLQFGLKEDEIGEFLEERGYSNIKNVTSDDYRVYFEGQDQRNVCSTLYFVHATVK